MAFRAARRSSVALALLLCSFGAASSVGPPVAESVVDFCVSSRWGFTCIAPRRSKALLDLSGGRLALVGRNIARTGARGTLAVGAVILAHETLREVQKLCDASPSPQAVQGGRGRNLGQPAEQNKWAGLLWGVE